MRCLGKPCFGTMPAGAVAGHDERGHVALGGLRESASTAAALPRAEGTRADARACFSTPVQRLEPTQPCAYEMADQGIAVRGGCCPEAVLWHPQSLLQIAGRAHFLRISRLPPAAEVLGDQRVDGRLQAGPAALL